MEQDNYYTQRPGLPQQPLQPQQQPQQQIAATPHDQAVHELAEAVGDAQAVLASATTVFPFVLFPDKITVDRTKVTIARSTFFKVGEIMSISIDDVLNVTADVGPFFGCIQITSRFYDDKKTPYKINFLSRDDTLRIKRIIQGYVIALNNKIDCSALGTRELADMLDELGKGASENIV